TALGQQYKRQKNFYEAKFYFIKACDQYNINGCQLAGEVLLIHEKKVADAEPFLTMACRGQNQIGCYNLACVHALLNKKNKALHSLEEALKLGFKEWEHVLKDPDLKNIQKLKDFGNLIEKYKKLKIN
ncbi:MAG: hypothetical protein HN509_09325, partial [Halobacteriovoraceae bacterium]|nr:hypothetical protein [Halobacteriovoraceae bacterium]